MIKLSRPAALAPLCLLLAAGCSSGTASATGKVLFDGKPVKSGSLIFYGPNGVGVPAVISADGTYAVEGLPVGSVRVAVTSPAPGEAVTALAVSSRAAPGKTAAAPKDPNWFAVPEKFGSPDTSGITLTLKSGSNEIDVTFK